MKKSSKIVPAVEPSANEVPGPRHQARHVRMKKRCSEDCTLEHNSVDEASWRRWLTADRRTSFRQSRAYRKYISSERGKRDQENPPVTKADFLRFLKQRTGWMGRNGCLVPPDFCHEYNDLERSPFSKALEKANDYLANQGLRPGMPFLSAESRIMDIDNLPDELETLRALATTNGLVWPVQDFKNDLKQMLQLMSKRAENVRKAIDQQGTLEKLGLRLRPEHGSLWGSLRQVNKKTQAIHTYQSCSDMRDYNGLCLWCDGTVKDIFTPARLLQNNTTCALPRFTIMYTNTYSRFLFLLSFAARLWGDAGQTAFPPQCLLQIGMRTRL